jgi:hypothetical protein
MAKFRPGMPEGFDLNVAPVDDLGDYLDEPGAKPVRVVRRPDPEPAVPTPPPVPEPGPTAKTEPSPVVHFPGPVPVEPSVRPAVVSAVTLPEPDREPTHESAALHLKAKAPRREISMTPETLRMSDELLDMIRSATGQRDAKANELFHAAILLLYEVRGELDLHRVPRRGKWGTPTARAFPVAIKSAFVDAVLARAKKS